ncbi:MAG: GNAT family N-acetyltransferase [Ferruginibacter sp.]
MEHFKTRKANLEDIDELYRLEQGVISAERPFDPTLKEDPIHYYDLYEMINAAHIELIVAEADNKIIGSGYARIEKSKAYSKHTEYAYLGFMYVHPDYRGKEVNKRVIEVLKDWVYQQNIKEFRLEVYYNNLPAIRAYEKIGFTKHMIEMRFSPE